MTLDRALELALSYTHRVLDGPTTLLARPEAREEARQAAAALGALREQEALAQTTTVRELEVTLESVRRDLEGTTAGLTATEALERAIKALRVERFGAQAAGLAPEEALMASASLFMDWLRLGGAREVLRGALLDALGDGSHVDKLVAATRDVEDVLRRSIYPAISEGS